MPGQNTEVKNNLAQFEKAMEGAQFVSEEAKEAHALMLQTMKNLVQETDRLYEKKALLNSDNNKQEEYLRQQEGGRKKERAGAEAPNRVRMSKEELFGEAAGRKSAPERPKEKERKAPEKAVAQSGGNTTKKGMRQI